MFTQEKLNAMSGPELVAAYNSIEGVRPVKRFKNRETGVRRIMANTAITTETVISDPREIQAALVRAEKGGSRQILERALASTEAELTPGTEPDTMGATPGASGGDPVAEAENAPKKRGRKRLPRGEYNLEAGPIRRSFRENSNRGRLVSVLTEGATFEQLLDRFQMWNEDQLHKTIRMVNWWLGFEISTDESGIIRATR